MSQEQNRVVALIGLAFLLVLPITVHAQEEHSIEFLATHPDLSGKTQNWLLALNTPCWVFDPYPKEGERVVWKGECKDSLASGRGVVIWRLNGRPQSIYAGVFDKGSLTGHGLASLPGGWGYEGEFIFNRISGHGKVQSPHQGLYEGEVPGLGQWTSPTEKCPAEMVRDGNTLRVDLHCPPKAN